MISFLFNSDPDCSGAKLNSEDGFPHSEICGSKVAHTSPQLIAACHVLHRLCMPRHPPIALTSRLRIHTTIDSPACMTGADMSVIWQIQIRPTARGDVSAQLDNQLYSFQHSSLRSIAVTASISRTHSQCQRSRRCRLYRGEPRISVCFGKLPGGAYRDRTDDLKLAKLALSQLS